MGQLAGSEGKSIAYSCEDWANTKAAYRFLSNSRVSHQEICQGHLDATAYRMGESEGKILILHDTTSFSYQREDPDSLGVIGNLVWKTKKTPLSIIISYSNVISI